jgi:hypothetical protein
MPPNSSSLAPAPAGVSNSSVYNWRTHRDKDGVIIPRKFNRTTGKVVEKNDNGNTLTKNNVGSFLWEVEHRNIALGSNGTPEDYEDTMEAASEELKYLEKPRSLKVVYNGNNNVKGGGRRGRGRTRSKRSTKRRRNGNNTRR